MADVLAATRTYLINNWELSALVSSRIFVDILPQAATLPAIAMYKVSESHPHKVGDRLGIVQTRITVACYSNTRAESNQIAEKCYRSGICAYRGVTGGVQFLGVTVDSGQENYIEYAENGSDDHRYVTEIDFLIRYKE